MRSIDIHAHNIPRCVANIRDGGDWHGFKVEKGGPGRLFITRGQDRGWLHPMMLWSTEERLMDMDSKGVDVHVLSTWVGLYYYHLDADVCRATARDCNDDIAALSKAYPSRFAGLANLPMQDVGMAVAELERCMNMGFKGAMINDHVNGKTLDEPEFLPFWQAAEQTGALICFHQENETMVSTRTGSKYHLHNSIGNLVDRAVTFATLVFSGVMDKFPNLNVLLMHGGGYTCFGLGRIDRGWQTNPATQANIAILRSRDVDVLGPADGSQACGEFGVGRMLEPDHLAEQVLGARGTGPDLAGVHVTITAGPTRERIDPVRFISNRSSGMMGFAVARAAAEAGARVCLVSGPVHLPTPPGVSRIDVESAEDMYQSVLGTLEDAQILIAAAAVSDYRPHAASNHKIKKGSGGLRLELDQATDILAAVAAREDAPFTVGFAAETDDVEAHAAEKMERKKLDMIAANRVGDGLGFDTRTNELRVLWPGGRKVLPECHKLTLARELVRLIAERYRQCRGGGA